MAKIRFNSKKMAMLLSGMSKVIQAKSVLPVMSNYKFEVSRNVMTVIAMNSQCCVSNKIEVGSDIENEFVFCIDAALFTSFMNKINSDVDMTFKEDGKVIMKHAYGKISMNYAVYDHFPAVIYPESYKSFKVNGTILSSMINEVSNSVEEDMQDRPILSSVCLDIKKDPDNEGGYKLIVAATDRFEMRVYSTTIEAEEEAQMIVSPYIASVMKGYIQDKEVEVRYDGVRTYFVCDDTYIYDINVEGVYPNYMNIVELSKQGNSIEVLLFDIKDRIGRIASLSDGIIKMYDGEDGRFHIVAKSKGDGWIEEDVRIMNNGSGFKGYFNVFLTKSMLQDVHEDNISLLLSEKVRCLRLEEESNGIHKILLLMQVVGVEF